MCLCCARSPRMKTRRPFGRPSHRRWRSRAQPPSAAP
jgi:hypothetical protein